MARRHPAGIYEATFPRRRRRRRRRLPPAGRLIPAATPPRSTTRIDTAACISDYDLYLFGEGNHTRIYDKLGAHPMTIGAIEGVHFAVWAPNATRVSVVGDFNEWDGRVHPMRSLGASGVWEIFVPTAQARRALQVRDAIADRRDRHQGRIRSVRVRGAAAVGIDRVQPSTRVARRRVDDDRRRRRSWFERPMAIYEVHLGSWARSEYEWRGGRRSIPDATASLPSGSSLTSRRWVTRTSNCCR